MVMVMVRVRVSGFPNPNPKPHPNPKEPPCKYHGWCCQEVHFERWNRKPRRAMDIDCDFLYGNYSDCRVTVTNGRVTVTVLWSCRVMVTNSRVTVMVLRSRRASVIA